MVSSTLKRKRQHQHQHQRERIRMLGQVLPVHRMKQITYRLVKKLSILSFVTPQIDHIPAGQRAARYFFLGFHHFSQIENIRLPLWEIGSILAFLRRVSPLLKIGV